MDGVEQTEELVASQTMPPVLTPPDSPLTLRPGVGRSADATLSAKERAQLAQFLISQSKHPSALKPEKPVVIIEMWAGIGALSAAFVKHGYPLSAFCESDPLLTRVLRSEYPSAQFAGAFEDYEWKKWTFPAEAIVVLVGGPSCVSLSSAGRQRFGKDRSSDHLRHTIEVAGFFKASFVILENVPEFFELDHQHGLRTAVVQLAASFKLNAVGSHMFRDSEAGGFTQRRRFFDFFEAAAVTEALPAWKSPVMPLTAPHSLAEVLLHEEDLNLETLLQHRLSQSGSCLFQPFMSKSGLHMNGNDSFSAVRLGTLHWRPKYPVQGALVTLCRVSKSSYQASPGNLWRVLQTKGRDELLVRLNDSKNPVTRWVRSVEVAEVREASFPVYSSEHPGVTLRRYGDPPIGNSFAILRESCTGSFVTTLAPIEAWRAHGLSDRLAEQVLLLKGSHEDLSEIAGNCITAAAAEVVVSHILSRLRLFRNTTSLPYSNPAESTPSLEPDPLLVTWEPAQGWHLPDQPSEQGSLLVVLIPVIFQSCNAVTLPLFMVHSKGCLGAQIKACDRGHAPAQTAAKKIARDSFGRPLQVMLSRVAQFSARRG